MSPLLKLLCHGRQVQYSRGCIQRKNMGYGTLCYRADDYKTSPYLKVDSEVQLSTPATTNAEECFPIIQKFNNQKEKGQYKEGEERGGSWLCVLEQIFYGAWATPCLSWLHFIDGFKPPERWLRIRAQKNSVCRQDERNTLSKVDINVWASLIYSFCGEHIHVWLANICTVHYAGYKKRWLVIRWLGKAMKMLPSRAERFLLMENITSRNIPICSCTIFFFMNKVFRLRSRKYSFE